jgi:hypothetical protein
MILVYLLPFLFIAASALAQTPQSRKQPTLERLCGKLLRTENIPIKGEPNSFTMKTHDLGHVTVSLYPAQEKGMCCDGSPISTTVTGRWGSFEFKPKRVPGGLYWLEIEPEGHKYSILVRYTPKRYSDQLCFQTYWDIDDKGNFSEGTFLTVD